MQVKGFEKANGYFEYFELNKQVGMHSTCKFRMSIRDEEADSYLDKTGQIIGIMLDDENPYPIFWGEIEEVILERVIARTCIEVTAISYSKKVDIDKKTRIFQDPNKKFSDFLNTSRLKLKNCELNLASEMSNQKYENILFQMQETDFEFIKRLSDYSDVPLWVIDTKQGQSVLKFAPFVEDKGSRLPQDKVLYCRIGREKDLKKMYLVTDQYFELGSMLFVGNDSCKYLIKGVKLNRIHATDKFSYELEEYKPKEIKINPKPIEKTIKLKARISDSKDKENLGRVQVQVEKSDAEDEDKEKYWLPYRSPYSGKAGGIVFLPDDKDMVELIFLNGECFVTSTLRENPLLEECQKVSDKYIGNNTKQRIFWKEKSLEILSTDNKIYLDKDKIELTVGKNKIFIDEKGIEFHTPKNTIKINEEGIETQTKGTWKVKSSGEAGIDTNSELKLLSNSKTQVQGSAVNVKATSGDVNISGSNIKLS